MGPPPRTRRARAGLAFALTALLVPAAGAQDEKKDKPPESNNKPSAASQATTAKETRAAEKGAEDKAKAEVTLKEPVAFRVYQRDRDGRAEIPVVLDGPEGAAVTGVRFLMNPIGGTTSVEGARFEDGKIVGLPTGGPYTIYFDARVGNETRQVSASNVFVGDLWVLAGQSNMEGVGDLIDVTPPNDRVTLLGMDGTWRRAEEPLHWLVDSPDRVHSGDPATRARRSAEQHKTRAKGAGLGLPFAEAMVRATGAPVGLIACAHGGTSMAQWDPAKKGERGNSLYGSMLGQVQRAGGRVKGVLWYQGESDANPERSRDYPKAFADFIEAVRSDLHQPELPFYFVQIGRFVHEGSPKDWNAVQDAQRRLAERVPNAAVVATVDLELDDGIHVGTQGLKRVGQRLARVALRELYGQVGATTPTFDRVNKGAGNTLVVRFKGVNIAPESGTGAVPGIGIGPSAGLGQGVPGGMIAPAPGAGLRQVAVQAPRTSPGAGPGPSVASLVGLRPARHVAGFSIRKEDGTEIPLIFDATVGSAHDTVLLKLTGPVPGGASLWYGYGYDPYCNLTDALDMAVPAFGPVPLDEVR
jgi:sialate O-acetylesterase